MSEPAREAPPSERRAIGACHYCFALLHERWEFQRDHFPTPRSAGGKATVLACIKCHDLKDRRSISDGRELFDADRKNASAGAWQTWADFIASIEEGSPKVAYRTARRMWSVWPTNWRITAGRLLGDAYR